MIERKIKLPYSPRRQFVPYHKRLQRWAIIVAHRRAGKTVACINDMGRRAALLETTGRAPGRYAYVGPFLSQAKETAWEYLKHYLREVIRATNEGELWVELVNRARIRIHGADNPDRLRGPYLDGAILDEYADWRPSVWGEVIRPMLADYEGWATFIGTPKGRNEFHAQWERAKIEPDRWYSMMLRASETGILTDAEIAEMTRDMTPEQIAQELECSFDAAILGAYYGKEIAELERQGRIKEVPHEPSLPVYTAWDLGISRGGNSMAIWFWQMDGADLRIIDFYSNHSQGLKHYADVLASKPYRYEQDFVPHDARVREMGTGRTRVETLIANGRKPRLVPDHKVADGINAAKLTLPKCWFDRYKCQDGLEALRQYRTDYDEKLKTFRDTPRHDWASHPADAFRYLAMAYRELVPEPEKPKPKVLMVGPGNQVTLDDLWEGQRRQSREGRI